MVMMIAPNGVLVDASEDDALIFKACGYKLAADEKAEEPQKPKRGRRKKTESEGGNDE